MEPQNAQREALLAELVRAHIRLTTLRHDLTRELARGSVIIRVILCSQSFWATTTKMNLLGLLTVHYLGTVGGEKGMRETTVEWTEVTWFLIEYFWVIYFICTHRDIPPFSFPETEECWGNPPAKKLSLLLQHAKKLDKKLMLHLNLCFLNDPKSLLS
jgi:hypothetical protein